MRLHSHAKARAGLWLVASLATLPGTALAAEALNNSKLSDTYISDAAPAVTVCKPAASSTTSVVASQQGVACPQLGSSGPLLNAAQDATVRQSLAQDTPHTSASDGLTNSAQVLQAIETALTGGIESTTTALPGGGLSTTFSGTYSQQPGNGFGGRGH